MTEPAPENNNTLPPEKPNEGDAIVIPYKKLLGWSNVMKFIVGVCTILGIVFSAVNWGVNKIEKIIEKKVHTSINEAIDARLNTALKMLDEAGADVTLLKLAENRTQSYISNNSYRLNYHERVMRDIVSYLHRRPPHDFIKPEELGFEDFKEK